LRNVFFFSEASICVSRKGGTGGGGWVHLKGANSMAVSGLSFENTLLPWCGLFLFSYAQTG